jgi:coenzyme F420-0:L-glutamate ligase / coenzyme F420-1:gamma-L-glutamate ligase
MAPLLKRARPSVGAAAACAARLSLQALPDLPIAKPGDDVVQLIHAGLRAGNVTLADGDVLVVTSKLLSRAEGRFVDLSAVTPSPRARRIARRAGKDARVVELILGESLAISRCRPGVLIVRHRLGFVAANAGIDFSNAQPLDARAGRGPWALLLPEAPDRSAEAIRAGLLRATGASVGVVVTDSHGRPFRLGTVAVAVGVAGLPPIRDWRGQADLFGRPLEVTKTAVADQVAAAAELVAGQADEGRAVVHVRGLRFTAGDHDAAELVRPLDEDLYA